MITCPDKNQLNLVAENLFFLERSKLNCNHLHFPGNVLKRMPESDPGHWQGDPQAFLTGSEKVDAPPEPQLALRPWQVNSVLLEGVWLERSLRCFFFFPGGLSGERAVGHMTQDNCCLPQVLGDLTHLSWLNGIKRLEKQEMCREQCCNIGAIPGCQWQPSRLPTRVDTRAPDTLTSAIEPAGVLTPEQGPKAQLALRAEKERDWKMAARGPTAQPSLTHFPYRLWAFSNTSGLHLSSLSLLDSHFPS